VSDPAEGLLLTVRREHLDQALRIFDRAIFKPEKARAMYRKSEILSKGGQMEDAIRLRNESIQLYHEITGQATGANTPTSADFDDQVAFWSK
jgi:tetratricopeptide (TPR) repeat protein